MDILVEIGGMTQGGGALGGRGGGGGLGGGGGGVIGRRGGHCGSTRGAVAVVVGSN